jgi:hypothetical protein
VRLRFSAIWTVSRCKCSLSPPCVLKFKLIVSSSDMRCSIPFKIPGKLYLGLQNNLLQSCIGCIILHLAHNAVDKKSAASHERSCHAPDLYPPYLCPVVHGVASRLFSFHHHPPRTIPTMLLSYPVDAGTRRHHLNFSNHRNLLVRGNCLR